MTLVWSTLIAVAAYLLKNEVLDPLHAFHATRWRIATELVAYEDVLSNTDMSTPEAKAEVRHLAADLRAAYMQVPFRGLLARLRLIHSGDDVGEAVAQLIGLSNSNKGDENRERIAAIREKLKII